MNVEYISRLLETGNCDSVVQGRLFPSDYIMNAEHEARIRFYKSLDK